MSDLLMSLGKLWLELRGRGKATPQYQFQENEIVSPPYPRKVSPLWRATYLNLHPTHYAVAIGPDGSILNLRGGYNVLSRGKYNIYYIDKQNRINHLPRTAEITSDGFQVAMELAITYRVIDVLKALEVQNAVDTLLRFIQSDLKEFIRTNKYDDIAGDLNGPNVANEQVARYIRQRHSTRHQMSKLFFIADVIVKEKIGDPKIMEQREKLQISKVQFAAQTVMQQQNQALEEKIARQEATIQKIKADSEVELQDLTHEMELKKIELDTARAGYQSQQENWRMAVDAIMNVLSNQTYPLDAQLSGVIRDLLMELRATTYQTPEAGAGQAAASPEEAAKPAGSGRVGDLIDILSNWHKQAPPA